MTATISRAALNSVLARAAARPQVEVCGLLLGEGTRITEARAAENVAAVPERRFELDPAVLLAAYREARQGGGQVLGHYHSHSGGDVTPSACDAEMARPDGTLWLICAPDGRFALWRAEADGLHGRFAPMTLHMSGE